uniref:Uncharacterized protein n=1 Tax=Oryza brachyantha TaxID=4533 RepID=J3MT47_ORYBR
MARRNVGLTPPLEIEAMQPRVKCQVPPELKTLDKRVAMHRNLIDLIVDRPPPIHVLPERKRVREPSDDESAAKRLAVDLDAELEVAEALEDVGISSPMSTSPPSPLGRVRKYFHFRQGSRVSSDIDPTESSATAGGDTTEPPTRLHTTPDSTSHNTTDSNANCENETSSRGSDPGPHTDSISSAKPRGGYVGGDSSSSSPARGLGESKPDRILSHDPLSLEPSDCQSGGDGDGLSGDLGSGQGGRGEAGHRDPGTATSRDSQWDALQAEMCQSTQVAVVDLEARLKEAGAMQSMYPRVDVSAMIEGFAADYDSKKALALMDEA